MAVKKKKKSNGQREVPAKPAAAAESPAAKSAGQKQVPAPAQSGIRTAAVLVLVAAALALGYYTLFVIPSVPAYDSGTRAESSAFLSSVQTADRVYLVMDLRNASSDSQRRGVMQCGVDFASSTGLAEKEILAMSIEGGSCITMNGTASAASCIGEALGNRNNKSASIFIRGGNETFFFNNRLVVGIGQNYTVGSCKINVRAR